MNKPIIRYSQKPVLEPKEGCMWADTMVLNPAIVKDPDTDTLHMLFRATGPWPAKNLKGKSDPYPIFLGYAKSDDRGETWQPDFSRPALALPTMEADSPRPKASNGPPFAATSARTSLSV